KRHGCTTKDRAATKEKTGMTLWRGHAGLIVPPRAYWMVAMVPPAAVGTAANVAPDVSCQMVPCEFVTNERVPVEPTVSGCASAMKSTCGAPPAAGAPAMAA